jgi:hypothetical protein
VPGEGIGGRHRQRDPSDKRLHRARTVPRSSKRRRSDVRDSRRLPV